MTPEQVRDKKMKSMTWPDKPTGDDMCLYCGIVKRIRHSWFCRRVCEDVYIEEYGKGIAV